MAGTGCRHQRKALKGVSPWCILWPLQQQPDHGLMAATGGPDQSLAAPAVSPRPAAQKLSDQRQLVDCVAGAADSSQQSLVGAMHLHEGDG